MRLLPVSHKSGINISGRFSENRKTINVVPRDQLDKPCSDYSFGLYSNYITLQKALVHPVCLFTPVGQSQIKFEDVSNLSHEIAQQPSDKNKKADNDYTEMKAEDGIAAQHQSQSQSQKGTNLKSKIMSNRKQSQSTLLDVIDQIQIFINLIKSN